jgi:hypothetical protein
MLGRVSWSGSRRQLCWRPHVTVARWRSSRSTMRFCLTRILPDIHFCSTETQHCLSYLAPVCTCTLSHTSMHCARLPWRIPKPSFWSVSHTAFNRLSQSNRDIEPTIHFSQPITNVICPSVILCQAQTVLILFPSCVGIFLEFPKPVLGSKYCPR